MIGFRLFLGVRVDANILYIFANIFRSLLICHWSERTKASVWGKKSATSFIFKVLLEFLRFLGYNVLLEVLTFWLSNVNDSWHQNCRDIIRFFKTTWIHLNSKIVIYKTSFVLRSEQTYCDSCRAFEGM